MDTHTHLVCTHCDQINRIPLARLAQGPRCGACKRALLDGKPHALDDDSFARVASRSGLPLVVDFWAAWCGPCKMMAPVFAQAAERLATRAVFVKVDTDAAQRTAARFDIRSIPTLIVMRDGREVARQAGATDLRRLLAFVEPHLPTAAAPD